MVDLFGADKGNISLSPRLQSPEVLDGQTDDSKHVTIINMQKAFYRVRITDITNRIQRLQSRNTELEDACIAEKLLRSQTDVETTDQIAQLNRQISGEMEKINDYKKRIQTVQKWIEEEKQTHLEKVEIANQKYDKARLEITSEIKVLNAKINVLEEYKTSKTDLRNKLIAGNNLITQRNEEAEQRCEQIQRKFKIGREKLKKEMYARLQGLAGTFQTEVAASVAKPMHRLIRENIFLKNELIDIVKESLPKKEMMKRNKEVDVQIIYETAALKKSTVKHLIMSKIQGFLLGVVKDEHRRLKDCVETLNKSENKTDISSAEVIYASTKINADKALQRISILETGLHKQNTQLQLLNLLKDKSKTELERCTNVLYDAKYAVTCALQMNDSGKDILEMGDKELMCYLLDILSKGDSEKWKIRIPSLATIPPPEEAYKIGDLGFEPSHIDLSSLRKMIRKRSSTLSTLKILEDLGVNLSAIDITKSQIEPEMDISDVDLNEKSSDSITEEMADKISAELSLSLESQEEELGLKSAVFEVVEEEERETNGEGENEWEVKVDTEEKFEEIMNGVDDYDNHETTLGVDEGKESEMLVSQSSKPLLQNDSSVQ